MIPQQWIVVAFVVILGGTYGYAHHAGYAQKEAEDAAEIARLNRDMTKQKEEQDAQDAHTKQEFETKLSSVLSSRPRLYVPVTTKGGCAATAANNDQARAELDGQTVEDLIRLVAEGDRAIIELNSCIDRYNQVKDTLDGHR